MLYSYVYMIKMTKTFARSDATMAQYIQMTKERQDSGVEINPFKDWRSQTVKEFEHWVIIPNKYPYDAIATVNHMITPKREVLFDWRLLTQEEEKELNILKETYLNENYDVVWENLPKGQTIPTQFHLHLLVLKREEV